MTKVYSKESIAQLISGTRRRINQFAWEKLRPCAVTPQQGRILLALYGSGRMSLAETAAHICNDTPTACRIVTKLVERGLVERDGDKRDRRRFRLNLTPVGRTVCEDVIKCMDGFYEALEANVPESDIANLKRILRRVMSNAVGATSHPDKALVAGVASLSQARPESAAPHSEGLGDGTPLPA